MITGKNVLLVPFEKKHLYNPSYLQWLRDPMVTKHIGRPELNQNTSLRSLIKYHKQISSSKYTLFFAVHEKKTNCFIGTAKMQMLKIAGLYNGVVDLGLMIGNRKFWGKGFGTDTLKALAFYTFTKLNARKLTGGTMGPNIAMIRAFLKVGFTIEGKLRKQILYKNKLFDHILFGYVKKTKKTLK